MAQIKFPKTKGVQSLKLPKHKQNRDDPIEVKILHLRTHLRVYYHILL